MVWTKSQGFQRKLLPSSLQFSWDYFLFRILDAFFLLFLRILVIRSSCWSTIQLFCFVLTLCYSYTYHLYSDVSVAFNFLPAFTNLLVCTWCIQYVSRLFLYRHLKLSKTLEKSVCYCYTSYEMTDQFLWFQIQMNSYSSNWNTPY